MKGNSFDSDVMDCTDGGTAEPNHFLVRRNLVHSMLDVALLLANVSQLRTVLHSNSNSPYYIPTLSLISVSIALQVIIALLMIAMWSMERQTSETSFHKCTFARSDSKISRETKSSALAYLVNNDNMTRPERRKEEKSAKIDKVVLILITFVIIMNVFITGIGLYEVDKQC